RTRATVLAYEHVCLYFRPGIGNLYVETGRDQRRHRKRHARYGRALLGRERHGKWNREERLVLGHLNRRTPRRFANQLRRSHWSERRPCRHCWLAEFHARRLGRRFQPDRDRERCRRGRAGHQQPNALPHTLTRACTIERGQHSTFKYSRALKFRRV